MRKITLLLCLCLISALSFAGINATTAISVKTFTPDNGASNVSTNTEVKVEFNQDVTLKDASAIQFVNTSNGSPVPFTANVEGAFLTLDYEGSLAYGTMYYVSITGAIEDFDTQTTWMFTIEADPNPVLIAGYTPELDATNVPVNTPIKVQFNQDITLQSQVNAQLSDMTTFGDTPAVSVSADQDFLILTYEGSLNHATKYMVELYNPVEGYSQTIRWFFTTEATPSVPIAVKTFTPDNGTLNVSANTEVKVEFNQDVTLKDASAIQFVNTSNGSPVPFTANVEGAILTLDYEGSLAYGTMYYVSITGAIEDFDTQTTWMFTIEADPNPVLIAGYTPESDATGVSINTSIKVQFNQDITLQSQANAQLSDMTTFGDTPAVSVSADQDFLILTYEGSLNHATKYMVEIFNPVEGYSQTIRWFFTTEDAPSVPVAMVSRTPNVDATNVSIDTEIKVEFNQNVTLNNGGLGFIINLSIPLTGQELSITPRIESNILYLDFEGSLEYGMTYYVELMNAVVGYAGYTGWSFTTEEAVSTPIAIVSRTPDVDATNVSANTEVKVEFNQDITLKDASVIQFMNTSNGNPVPFTANVEGAILTLDYEGPLAYGTMYFVNITNAIEDFDAMTSWTFTVEADPNPVTIVGYTPESDATGISINTLIKVQFNQDITLQSQANAQLSDMTNFGDTPAVSVSADQDYLILTYEGTLNYETKYMVEVFNPAEGYSETIRWFFTTEDVPSVPVAIVSRTPDVDATNVSSNTEVKVEFNQDITLKDASVIQFMNTSNGNPVPFTANIEGAILTLDYEGSLAYGTMYFVNITNAIEDFDAATSWTFTVETDPNPVTIVGYTPESDATGISINTLIKVQFNQDITLQSQVNAQLSDMTNFGDTPAVSVSADQDFLILTYEGTLNYETKYMVEVFNPAEGYNETIRWFFTTAQADGIDSVAAEMVVYPNPTTDYLYIKSSEVTSAKVYNLQGVKLIETSDKKIDLSTFDNGIYVVDVNDVKTKVVKK